MARRSLRNGKKMGGRDVGPVAAMPIGEEAGTMAAISTKPGPVTETSEVAALKTILGTIKVSGDGKTMGVDITPEGKAALESLMKSLETPSDEVDAALASYLETTYPQLGEQYEKLKATSGGRRRGQRGGFMDKVVFFKMIIGVIIAFVFFGYLYMNVSAAQAAYDLVNKEWSDARDGICTGEVKSGSPETITGLKDVVKAVAGEVTAAKAASCAGINAAFSNVANNALIALNNSYSAARLSVGGAAAGMLLLIGFNSREAAAFISMVAFMFTGAAPSSENLGTIKGFMDAWGAATPQQAEAEAIRRDFDAEQVLADAEAALVAAKAADPQEPRAVRTAELAVKLAKAAKKAAALNYTLAAAAMGSGRSSAAASLEDGSAAAGTGLPLESPGTTGRRKKLTGGRKTRGKKSKRRVTRRKATTVKFAY
jgi:hypothetical protein